MKVTKTFTSSIAAARKISRENVESFSLSLAGLWELFEDRNLHFFASLFTVPVVLRPLVPSPSVMKMIQDCQATVNVLLFFGVDKVG